jgi:Zn-dependent peptidase ImmA (M78 family)
MKIKVLGLTYQIITTQNIQEFGRIDYERQIIYIKEGLHDNVRRLTIWHELMHAIEYATGMDLGEQNVDCLASGIFSILTENGAIGFLKTSVN